MPIIQKLVFTYKIWHEYLSRLPKTHRYSLGLKIDSLFLEVTEHIVIATHKNKENKLVFLNRASDKLDVLKFLLQITWELAILDRKKYIIISTELHEVGKMLGGWQKQTKTP